MAAIGLVVLLTCRDVTIFLIETGLLFQDFSHRVAALAKPAVAFLTFYSMMVIVFACVYRIVAALQVVSGVLLLLFGMQVLMSYARR